jgi:protein arginine kinase activator
MLQIVPAGRTPELYLSSDADAGMAHGSNVTERAGRAMKCQKCPKVATLHITEIIDENSFEELHLCEECAHKYLYEPAPKASKAATAEVSEEVAAQVANQECPVCGLKFVDFRQAGRLGCAHDYVAFREQLTPLLENIHGEIRHCGKSPKRSPPTQQTQAELAQLRKQLTAAINREAYEEAAQLRDRIRRLEES